MNLFITWTLITLFIFLFVNQIYLYFKQSNIKEGVQNNEHKSQVYANKNDISNIQKEVNQIGKIINQMQSKSINNQSKAFKQSRDIDEAVENKKEADEAEE